VVAGFCDGGWANGGHMMDGWWMVIYEDYIAEVDGIDSDKCC